jgi:hypothetical protein
MLDTYSTTQILAALIGLYFAAAGIGLVSNSIQVSDMFRDLKAQPMVGYLGGLIAFTIGGAILAVHYDWSSFLAGFVTFVGWAALFEGVLLLAARDWFLDLFSGLAEKTGLVKAMGWLTTVAGLVLLYCGLS